jgi:hypothetical protein
VLKGLRINFYLSPERITTASRSTATRESSINYQPESRPVSFICLKQLRPDQAENQIE